MTQGPWHDTGSAEMPESGVEMRDVDGRMVMIVRQGDEFHATDAVCPHKFTLLTEGTFGDACVTCPQHDATFDLRTGDAGDDASWAGTLPVHEVRLEGERLMVRLAN